MSMCFCCNDAVQRLPASRHPHGKSVVDLYDYFEHDGPNGKHVCMVFEVMGPNLLTLIKQYNFSGVRGAKCLGPPRFVLN